MLETKSLIGLSAVEISNVLNLKEKYRGKQIFEWINRGIESFDDMINLPAPMREKLRVSFSIYSSSVVSAETDSEKTAKTVIKLEDGSLIEAVLLSDENDRATACLSVQVGCAMGCTFCRTGKMGLQRNLSSAEII